MTHRGPFQPPPFCDSVKSSEEPPRLGAGAHNRKNCVPLILKEGGKGKISLLSSAT